MLQDNVITIAYLRLAIDFINSLHKSWLEAIELLYLPKTIGEITLIWSDVGVR
jgi:hypothetical protein